MSPMKIFEKIYVGDIVQMRKPHPCGNDIWEVHRVGADIGMTCRKCQRRTMMNRRNFTHRMRKMLERGPEAESDKEAEIRGEGGK
jgi:hypothetical protein